jgi:thiol-disulfide isomerase/thioredoxin
MKVRQIGDWTLEDRLAAGGPPVVVMFLNAEGRADRLRRIDFRRVAGDHPEASFYEVDLIENPSLKAKYSIKLPPTVLIFMDGSEVARHGGPFIASTIVRVLGPCHQEGEEP